MSSGDSRHVRAFRVLAYVVVFTVVAGIAWGFAYARWRRNAILNVRLSGGLIDFAPLPEFIPKSLRVPGWLRRIDSVTLLMNNTKDDELKCLAGFPVTRIVPSSGFGIRVSPKLSDAAFPHLAGCPLETLWLVGTRVTGEGFVHLSECSSLRVVSVEGGPFNDAGLAHLARIRALEFVGLAGTTITDAGLGNLRALPNLKHLDLSRTDITDEGLRQLAGLRLKRLSLGSTRITDDGLRHLANLEVENLYLDCTHVTDAGLQDLAKMPLRNLRLCGSAVTPTGLCALVGMKTLEEVVVDIPDEQLEELRAKGLNVRCHIYGNNWDGECHPIWMHP